MKKILSLDGGGVRGIMPSLVLAEIEKRTGRNTSDMFDLIAGTSTGGILALGLTTPDYEGRPKYAAQDLVSLYENKCSSIFCRSIWNKVRGAGNLLEEKYPSKFIDQVLHDYFGDSRLKAATTNVLVTSYDIENRQPYFFKSTKAVFDIERDHYMRDIARATSAAPTYFEPSRLGHRALIDGGVYANNPAMCAYVEAKTLFPEENDFLVISLGTGEAIKEIPYDKAKKWGVIGWAQPILYTVFDGVSDTVDYQLSQIIPEGKYFRIQTVLTRESEPMDKTDKNSIERLKSLAFNMIHENSDSIDRICEYLQNS